MNKKIKVLSLFDGISGARQALKNLNIDCEYHAYEIDKYAISIAQANHPDIVQHGDVLNASFFGHIDTDLLIAGSPCQGFSFAGKQLNFDDPRSKLFFEFVRILKEIKPRYFLLENVKMKKEYQDIISNAVGVEPIEINSALVTAQNRKRLYWTNISGVKEPKDQKILLSNILEFKDACVKVDKNGKTKNNQNKASCLTGGGHSGGNHSDMDVLACRMTGRRINEQGKRDDYNMSIKPIQRIEINSNPQKTNCLTTVQKDNLLAQIRKKSKTVRGGGRGSCDRHEWDSIDNVFTRRLTPLECERLQGFPDNFTAKGNMYLKPLRDKSLIPKDKLIKVSNTQRYKALGNSFTVPVIEHILKGLK